MENKKRFHVVKWIYLAIAILLNGFIIMHSCLSGSTSAKWSNAFVSFFIHLFNSGNTDTSTFINVEGIDVTLDQEYEYNKLIEYQDNEIGIGNDKRYTFNVSPSSASNKAIKYEIEDPSIFKINQIGDYLYVTALKAGHSNITVSSESNASIKKTLSLSSVEKKAPTSYTYQNDIDIYEGGLIDFKLTTGNLNRDHYYDFNKLNIDVPTSFASFDNLIYTVSTVGEYLVHIEDKVINIHVHPKTEVIYPAFKSINVKDEIISGDEASVEVLFNNEPTSKDVYYKVNNPSLASISQNGLLSIKEGIKENKEITITAYSYLDPTYQISKTINIKPVLVTDFELVLDYYGTHVNDMPMLGEISQTIKIWYFDDTYHIYEEGITVASSNEEVAKAYVQGHSILINCLKEGKTQITATSNNNPNVSHYIDLEVTIKGVINYENYQSFSEFIRKSIGHFLLFLASGVFTFLTLYTFLINNKKKYLSLIITIGIGLFIAILSEVIQYFVPTRFGSVIDVLTDFGGFILGTLITFLVIYLIKRHKKKELEKK